MLQLRRHFHVAATGSWRLAIGLVPSRYAVSTRTSHLAGPRRPCPSHSSGILRDPRARCPPARQAVASEVSAFPCGCHVALSMLAVSGGYHLARGRSEHRREQGWHGVSAMWRILLGSAAAIILLGLG